jgi:signal recognition particle subunit SRP54
MHMMNRHHKRPLLVAADVYRPAAIDQLKILGQRLNVPVYSEVGGSPPDICERALKHAQDTGRDMVIYDTAGRLALDETLMTELDEIKRRTNPGNILFVVDAMIGQDAVATAKTFNDRLNYDGVVLTKLDGDARGGAALSIKSVTGKPIKFVGMGESSERLEEFRPDGMASRILGRGDVVGLIQQFEDVVDEEKAEQDAMRMLKGKFDMNDFLEQIGVLQKMGSLAELVEKIPGVSDAMPEGAKIDDNELVRIKAIISSMTQDERQHPDRFVFSSWEEVLDNGRRKKKRSAFYDQNRVRRVARGSGRKEAEVADVINRFGMMRQMMMQIGAGTGLLGKIPGFKQLAQMKKFAGVDVNQLASLMNSPSAERGGFQAPKRNVDKAKDKRKRKDARKARKKARR